MPEASGGVPRFRIRPEAAGDGEAVYGVNERAFGGPAEARLVGEMHALDLPLVSLVAEAEGRVIGHVLFSPVRVEDGDTHWDAMALGPVAVEPDLQQGGVGGALIRAGLEVCGEQGARVVFVLGHPEYYPRFGFRPASPHGLHYRTTHFDPAFFVLELEAGAVAGRKGFVRYAPPFEGT